MVNNERSMEETNQRMVFDVNDVLIRQVHQVNIRFYSSNIFFSFIFVALTEDQSRSQHKSKPSSNQVNMIDISLHLF